MPLPDLDRDSHQYVCSEWVQYAGQLLQAAGYLHSDPSGNWDAEFAAAVNDLQQANGIGYEPDLVGAATWSALGAVDPDVMHYHHGGDHQDGDHHGGDQHGGHGQDQGTYHHDPNHPPAIAANPGLEMVAGGKRYIIYPDEVREQGSVAWRARNPGNIRLGESYGAYPGKRADAGKNGTFAVFPDEETGFAAIALKLHDYGHVTVFQAMEHYAPAKDHNDPKSYAAIVAAHMGVTVDTYVDTLDASQLQTFSEAIRQVEGWREDNTYALDDPALPDAVKKAIAGQ